jgi:predicted TIM-barrel fold metal-dependent hydrolase
MSFMATHGIKKSVLSISTPQANAFASEPDLDLRRMKTRALARLLNEYVAEVVRLFPERYTWMCVTPLPYVDGAVAEVEYAMGELGAVGVGVLTNHEGLYPGDGAFDPLWEFVQGRAGRGVVFVHPTEPVVRLGDGRIVGSKPCEFFFLFMVVGKLQIAGGTGLGMGVDADNVE